MTEKVPDQKSDNEKIYSDEEKNKAVIRAVLIIFGLLILFGIAAGGTSSTSYDTTNKYDTNYGYSKKTATELRRMGVDPSEARAIEEACGEACE